MPRTAVAPLSSRDTELRSYHAGARDRITRGIRRELYGLELEVRAGSENQRTAAIRAANIDEPEELRVDAEQDGSLSSYEGVEFITRRPLTVREFLNNDGWLGRFTDRIVTNGITAGQQPRGYGIHINVNCFGWSEFAKQAYCCAVNFGRAYCEPVAGRPGPYNSRGIGMNLYRNDAAPFITGFTGRSGPAYVRAPSNPDCIEVRIFQSTTDAETIRSYIRHLQEIRRFSKRYQTLLLYIGLGYQLSYFTHVEAETFVHFLWTERPSYAQAIARLPDTAVPRPIPSIGNYNAHVGGSFSAIFDTSTTFRVRKEALRRAWIATELTQEQTEDTDNDDYYDSDDDDNDY